MDAMKEKGIRLSPKHGVNPSLSVCFYCGADDGTVVLPGRLRGDTQAPHKAVWTKEPCPTCREYMRQGIILISVRDGEEGDNPYRTGGFSVVKAEALARLINRQELIDDVLRRRVCFVPDAAWAMLGLPS